MLPIQFDPKDFIAEKNGKGKKSGKGEKSVKDKRRFDGLLINDYWG